MIELVPKTSWYGEVRELVDAATWELISRKVAGSAAGRCQLCGDPCIDEREALQCHELWRYDDRMRVQALARIVALCPDCHRVLHMGSPDLRGGGTRARAHLARVNRWTLARTDAHIAEAFRLWARRSRGPWILDLEALRPYVAAADYGRIARRAATRPATR